MQPSDLIIEVVRGFLSLDKMDTTFDNEILPHINSAVGKIYQNGACKSVIVNDTTTWADISIDGTINADYFTMIPLYISMNVKLLFDPPPPSMVEPYQRILTEHLWRLKIAYETREVVTNE